MIFYSVKLISKEFILAVGVGGQTITASVLLRHPHRSQTPPPEGNATYKDLIFNLKMPGSVQNVIWYGLGFSLKPEMVPKILDFSFFKSALFLNFYCFVSL